MTTTADDDDTPPAKRARGPGEEEKGEEDEDAGVHHTDTNGVPLMRGRTFHVGLAKGEIANRIVCVGSEARAEMLATSFLEPEVVGQPLFRLTSDRSFTTFTGLFQGTRVSICSMGMGLAMMDFFIRETRQSVEGPMAVVRLGTCGFLREEVGPGVMGIASKGSVLVRRNFAAFAEGATGEDNYTITAPCPADAVLSAAVVKEAVQELGAAQVTEVMNATADSFYSSQGRRNPKFDDRNEGLHAELLRRHPEVCSLEMETFMLLHLAQVCRPKGSIRAAATAINIANRKTAAVVSAEQLHATELRAGNAIMRALVGLAL